MAKNWATRDQVGFDVLERVQDSLTVDMIMTPRRELMTCRREDMADSVMRRNTDQFSFLPVEDGEEHILGLYETQQWFQEEAPHRPIGDNFDHLSEDMMIGTNAGILEFVKTADQGPARLVVGRNGVVGMVTLSDLQQLPVRAALFTLITSLEMAMANWIDAKWPNDAAGWREILSDNRQESIQKQIEEAKQNDGFVSEVLNTQLFDKTKIIREQGPLAESKKALKKDFELINDLRDKVAHANFFAETPSAACRVSATTRRIFQIKADLLQDTVNLVLD